MFAKNCKPAEPGKLSLKDHDFFTEKILRLIIPYLKDKKPKLQILDKANTQEEAQHFLLPFNEGNKLTNMTEFYDFRYIRIDEKQLFRMKFDLMQGRMSSKKDFVWDLSSSIINTFFKDLLPIETDLTSLLID
jgi:hypothetical protein